MEAHREGVPKGEWGTIQQSFVNAPSGHQLCAYFGCEKEVCVRQGCFTHVVHLSHNLVFSIIII